jgi:hypothetical protein
VPVLAELDVHHSRAIAPTRRVALGDAELPVDPAPGFGGILLGGIVAANVGGVDQDLLGDLQRLLDRVEHGERVAQPQLRHRLQVDRVGLLRARYRLIGEGEQLRFDLDQRATPAQAVLGAVYAAGRLPVPERHVVMAALRRAVDWRGPVGPGLVAELTGGRGHQAVPPSAANDPRGWALVTLGLTSSGAVVPADVLRQFRALLRQAHPDHGGEGAGAAGRIAELTAARRILLDPPMADR